MDYEDEIYETYDTIKSKLEDLNQSLSSYFQQDYLIDNFSIKHKIHLLKSMLYELESKIRKKEEEECQLQKR